MAEKLFHTRIPNSTFVYQPKDSEGKPKQGVTDVLQFHGIDLLVSDPAQIEALEAAADTPGSLIYTKDKKAVVDAAAKLAFEQVKERAGDVVEKMAKAGIKPA